MTDRLSSLFGDLTRRKEELESILASIREGLAVFDRDGRLTLANESFKKVTGEAAPEGRYYWEVVRSPGFQDLVMRTRAERAAQAAEFRIGENSVLGATSYLSLQDGVLAVLRDISG
jgi:PAS domain S-box-containing protein